MLLLTLVSICSHPERPISDLFFKVTIIKYKLTKEFHLSSGIIYVAVHCQTVIWEYIWFIRTPSREMLREHTEKGEHGEGITVLQEKVISLSVGRRQ